MRITIITVGSRGDVQPYIPLGVGLKAAGHQVRLATHTNFEAEIRGRGLDFFPVEGNPRSVLEGEDGRAWLESGANPINFARRLTRVARPLMNQILNDSWNACQGTEAILFSVLGLLAAQHIIEKLKVPFLPAFLQPVTPTRSFPNPSFPPNIRLGGAYNRVTYAVVEEIFWRFLRKPINEARRQVLDLPPMPFRNPFGKAHKERNPMFYGYSPSVLPKPPDWGEWLHVTGYWFLDRDPDWKPPADLLDFLESGPPPIYVGFGSMNNRNPEKTTDLVLKALKRTGQRGILALGWGGLGDAELPDEVFRLDSAPHDWLFPRMAAVVHHGGAGTTAAGLRAGVPTIITPFFIDQYFWAHRVHELGAGPKPIPFKRLSTESLAKAIEEAVRDEGIRSRAAAMGRSIRAEDGVARAVEAFHHHLHPYFR